jgi:hypothetical protein
MHLAGTLQCPFDGIDLRVYQPGGDHAQNLYIGLVGIIKAGRVNKGNRVVVYWVRGFDSSNIRRERSQSMTDVSIIFSCGCCDELLLSGQDDGSLGVYSNGLTELFPAPVGPITLGGIERYIPIQEGKTHTMILSCLETSGGIAGREDMIVNMRNRESFAGVQLFS